MNIAIGIYTIPSDLKIIFTPDSGTSLMIQSYLTQLTYIG